MTSAAIGAGLPLAPITPIRPDDSGANGESNAVDWNAAPRVSALAAPHDDPAGLFGGLVQSLEDGDRAFGSAQRAENAVVAGHGDIQTMIFERARADAMLQIASGAAAHLTQSLNTILQMQI